MKSRIIPKFAGALALVLMANVTGAPAAPAVNPFRNVGRNDPCPCGSGKKAKKCCLANG